MDKKALWEAIKLPLRVFVLSILPFLTAYFTGLGVNWAVGLSAVLVALDKYLHIVWKENKNIKANGLIPF